MIRTPLQLQFLLHCHVLAEPHDMIGNEAHRKARDFLVQQGMIEVYKEAPRHSDYVYTTTEKGKFFINHLMGIPFPEPMTTWAIPEQQVK